MENISAKKIQLQFRISQITKKILSFKDLKIIDSAKSLPFDKFRKIILDKSILEKTKSLLESIQNYKKGIETNPRILLTAYLITFYSQDFLGDDKDRHFSDNDIYVLSQNLVNSIENYQEETVQSFCNQYLDFHYAFKNWIRMDKERTIERAIVSYYYRSEHVDKIKEDMKNVSNNKADMKQLELMLNEIEKQRQDIIKSIKMIDHTFDVEYFKDNYKLIYSSLEKSWKSLLTSLSNNMKKAYYDMLCDELSKGNKLPIFNLIKEIGERLLLITPEKRKEAMSQKFMDDKISDILMFSDWNEDIIKFIYFIVDLVILLGAAADDEENKKWKDSLETLFKEDYNNNLPKVLIQIEEKIDRIYQLIIDFNENIKK